jgi:hypothetical protein
MKGVELYGRVRHAMQIEGLSRREAGRRFGIDPRTVAKMLAFSVPPGYRRGGAPKRPKLDPFVGIIDRILEEDKSRQAKQRHTSKRIFERRVLVVLRVLRQQLVRDQRAVGPPRDDVGECAAAVDPELPVGGGGSGCS